MTEDDSGSMQWKDLGKCQYPDCDKDAIHALVFEDEQWFRAEMNLCDEHAEEKRNEGLRVTEPNRYRNSKRFRVTIDYSSDVGPIPIETTKQWFLNATHQFETEKNATGLGNFELFRFELYGDGSEKRMIGEDD